MRNYMKIVESALVEDDFKKPETEVKDKTTDDLDLQFEPMSSKGEVSTSRRTSDVAPSGMPGKKAGKSRTRSSVRAPAGPEAGGHISNLMRSGAQDEISDADAARNAGADEVNTTDGAEPRTPENLPAVISTALADTGADFEPNWHMVKHLPGYLQSAIRGLGRQVFRQFTDTPVEDIQVLCTLSNDESEVRAMMAWIKHNGVRDDRAEMDFSNIMPGYHAEVQLWNTRGYSFLLVRDFGGFYVYGWPGGRGVHVDAPAARRALPRR